MKLRALAVLFFCLGVFCLGQQPRAYWQSRDSNYNTDVSSGGNVFSTYTQTDNPAAQADPGSTTLTYTSANIGTAASNRVVVLEFSSSSFVALTATVGGVSLTKDIQEGTGVSGLQFWHGTVPSGTTANVVFTFAGNPTNCLLVVGSFNSGASATPADTQSAFTSASNTQANNTTIPSGGFAVMASVQQQTALKTPTWTNMTAAGGDVSQTSANNIDQIYSAHSTTAGSPTALSVSLSGATGDIHSASVSWGP